jgi:capsular exopolysaccharide synthesis family protein
LAWMEWVSQEPPHLAARAQQVIRLDGAKEVESGRNLRRSFDKDKVDEQLVLAQRRVTGVSDEKMLAAEQYKLLCTRILEVARTQRGKVFLVTSSLPDEGKTLTSMNIAYGLSHLVSKRILLVELDLRRPSMHNFLGVCPMSTDMTFLESSDNWRESLWPLQQNLDALLALNPSKRPDELVQGERMQRFIKEAREEYDLIVVDSPPLLVASDTHALLPIIDHALMVVRADRTPISCARDALGLLGNKALGCILNDLRKLKYEEHYSRYYISGT